MKSIRYRKLMEAARRHAQNQPLDFIIKTGENESCQCSLTVWKEQLFYSIEKGPPLKQLLLQFKDWIDLPYQVLGKKSSQIALSRSRVYCLKILNTEDVEEFQRIIQDYSQFKKVEECMLVPVFGLLSLYSHSIQKNNKWTTHFLFMPYFGNNAVVFDIKGHCDNRVVDERDFKDFKFGKDQNFIKSSFLAELQKLDQQKKRNLFQKIETNVQFLKKVGVIDYSLLLIFRPKYKKLEERYKAHTIELNEANEMSICIIDFLQGYNSKKKLQNKIKTIFFKEVSSVDPQAYAKRLLQFMKKVLLIK